MEQQLKNRDTHRVPLSSLPLEMIVGSATGIVRLGFSNEVIGRVLNHTIQGVTAIYNRYRYEDQIKEALDAWHGLIYWSMKYWQHRQKCRKKMRAD